MSESKKYFTFLNIVPAQKKDGGTFQAATIISLATRAETRMTGTGKKIVSFSVPVQNRSNRMNAAIGTNFSEKEETIWLRASIWEDRADAFEKFLGDRTSVRLVLCGSLSKGTWTDKEGKEHEQVNFSVTDWAPAGGSSEGNAAPASKPAAKPAATATPAPTPAPVAQTSADADADNGEEEYF